MLKHSIPSALLSNFTLYLKLACLTDYKPIHVYKYMLLCSIQNGVGDSMSLASSTYSDKCIDALAQRIQSGLEVNK